MLRSWRRLDERLQLHLAAIHCEAATWVALVAEGQTAEWQRVECRNEFVIGVCFVMEFLAVDSAEHGEVSDRVDKQMLRRDPRFRAERPKQTRIGSVGLLI